MPAAGRQNIALPFTRADLIRYLHVRRYTIQCVAEIHLCDMGTVRWWCRAWGVYSPRRLRLTDAEWRQQFAREASDSRLARKLKCHPSTITHHRKRLGARVSRRHGRAA